MTTAQRIPHTHLAAPARALLLFIALLAAAAGTLRAQDPSPANSLSEELNTRITDFLAQSNAGERIRASVWVQDARTGRIVFERDSETPMTPASLLKIATAAASLELLQPSRRFQTTLLTEGEVSKDGVLSGTLRLVGGGDPSFGPRFQSDRTDTTKVFRDMARDLRRMGVREVRGPIVADDTLFDREDRFATGWPRRERGEWYCAEVSALSYNDNTIDVTFRAGSTPNDRTRYSAAPQTKYAVLVNNVRAGRKEMREPFIRFIPNDSGKEIVARGAMPPSSTRTESAAVRDPALFTATVFSETLAAEGIKVTGKVRKSSDVLDKGREYRTLLTTEGASVEDVLPVVLAISQNLYAEILLRHIAIAMDQPATFEGGSRALETWIRRKGYAANGIVITDGSGLSRINRLSARLLGEILFDAGKGPHAALFRASLAVPGQRGSMRTRFAEQERRALQGRLWAKTGYIDNTHGLAGYFRGREGDYVFVIMLNNVERDAASGRRMIEDIFRMVTGSDVIS